MTANEAPGGAEGQTRHRSVVLVPVDPPAVLPGFVSWCSARLVGAHPRMHFAAGRECAAQALTPLLGSAPICPLPRGPAGEPIWPDRTCGSITHTGDYIAAAAALLSTASSLGLDAESIVAPDRAERVAPVVLRPGEAPKGADDLPFAIRVTLLFSIKEAVFKCLYPIVQQRFYYPALRIMELDCASGRFRAELTVALSNVFPAGRELVGHFQVEEARVYSGVCLPPEA